MATNRTIGTRNADLLVGTPDRTIILGLAGNDSLLGDGDVTRGDGEKALLRGNADQLFGGLGNDMLWGDGRVVAGGHGAQALILGVPETRLDLCARENRPLAKAPAKAE